MKANGLAIIKEVEKEFGVGTLVPASSLKRQRVYRSTGSIVLDVALGGGWSKSIIVDVVGKYSAGKTLLFELAALTAQQNEHLPSVIFDFEAAFDPTRFEMLGGDLNNLYIVRAENFLDGKNMFIEWAGDMLKSLLDSKSFACIGMDSTAAMVSVDEFEIKEAKGEEASTVAYTARAMSSLLKQIVGTGLLARSGVTVFFMSQMRANIGGRTFKGMPPADNRTGGRALPFYASVQVEVSRGDTFKGDVEYDTHTDKDVEYAHETKVRIRKNKCNSRQGRLAVFDIYTEGDIKGLNHAEELTKVAIAVGLIKKSGKWHTFSNGDRVGSKDEAEAYVAEPKHYEALRAETVKLLDAEQERTAQMSAVLVDESEDESD